MADNRFELATQLGRCQAGIAALMRQTAVRAERAGRLAELLLQRIPAVGAAACLLRGAGSEDRAVRPENGPIGPKHMELLRSLTEPSGSAMTGVRTLPADAVPADWRLLGVAIQGDGCHRGFLFIGLPAAASAEEMAQAEALLTVCAHTVALCRELEASRAERGELARFALIGQAFIGLTHELNNALNSMMLQTSVVQMRVDAQSRNELAGVRQHGIQAAALVRSLQHVVQERRAQSYAVDLNAVIADVLEEDAELSHRVTPQFTADTPQIQSTNSAVKQLVRLVLEGVCAGGASALQLRTEKRGDGAALILEIADQGEAPSADAILWRHLDDVGRQAGQSLLRQLGGSLTVKSREEGGVRLQIQWGSSSLDHPEAEESPAP